MGLRPGNKADSEYNYFISFMCRVRLLLIVCNFSSSSVFTTVDMQCQACLFVCLFCLFVCLFVLFFLFVFCLFVLFFFCLFFVCLFCFFVCFLFVCFVFLFVFCLFVLFFFSNGLRLILNIDYFIFCFICRVT